MKRFLETLKNLMVGNWWLKLLALTLAIVVYYGLRKNDFKHNEGFNRNGYDRSLFQSR